MSNATLVLEGSLDEVSLDDILNTVSLSRSCLRVEIDEGDAAIVVKAGTVLHARAGASGPEGTSAVQALRRRQRGKVRVYRQPFRAGELRPIGNLAELLRGATASTSVDPEPPKLILSGVVADSGLTDVLDVMSLSRQRMELRLSREDGSEGVLLCKSGLVCEARIDPNGWIGRRALLDMRRVGIVSYALYRRSEADRLPRPLGSLVELQADRRDERRRDPAKHHSVIRGEFDEHSFLDILSIVTASRQVLKITVTRRRAWRGTVLVKSGKLLEAKTNDGRSGVKALLALISDPGDAFDVVLARHATLPEEPLGDLRELTSLAAQGDQGDVLEDEPMIVTDELDEFEDLEVTAVRPRVIPRPAEPDDPSEAPTPAANSPRPPERSGAGLATPAPPPEVEVAEPRVDVSELMSTVARLEADLTRQDAMIREALDAEPPAPRGRGLLAGVLVAQGLVAALMVLVLGVLLFT